MLDDLAPDKIFSLKGRVAFITGGAGGIAGAIANAFAAAGARLVLADRNPTVETRAQTLRFEGVDASAMTLDVTDAAAVRTAIETTAEKCGSLDIVVNNAAIIVRKPFLDLTQEEWQRVMDINVTACFTVAQAAARVMVGRKRGRIVNLGSIMNHVSRPMLVPYTTSKGAIGTMTRAIAADLGGTGVTINALAPGYTATEFSMASNKEFHDFIADWTPARRWGKPEDLAGPALLLASDAGAYINGQILYVDGGFLAVTK